MLYSRSWQRTNSPDTPHFQTCFVRNEQGISDIPRNWNLHYNKAAIGVVLSGCFDYRAPNGMVTAVPGSVIFGNPGESFVVHHPGPVGNRRLVLWFDTAFLKEIAASLGLDNIRFDTAALPPGRMASALFARMKSAAREGNEEDASELAAVALTFRDERRSGGSTSPQDRQHILSVVRHIEKAYSEPCTVARLSALCGLDRYRFMRAFKDVTGQTSNQYVLATRLRLAVERIAHSNAPFSEIALDVGFNDVSHFNNCFKAVFHCTPRQMRAKQK